MNYQPQNNQLPFDPINCMSQPQQFNQAPFIPNNIPVPPQLSSFIPVIATMVVNETSANCGKNAGRMFLFNQLSSNGYMNQEYVEAVQTAVDMLLVGMVKGQYRDPNQGVSDAVSKALIMCHAANFQKFPALQQYVSSDVFSNAVHIVNTLPNVKSDIMQAKQQMNQIQQPMMNNSFNNNMGNPFPQPFNQPIQTVFQQPRMNPGMQPVNTNNVFHSSNQQQPSQPINNQFVQAGRYDHLRANATASPAQVVTPVPPVPPGQPFVNQSNYFTKASALVQNIEISEQKELVWRPSAAQWHPVTCNTLYEKIVLKEVLWADNNTYVVSAVVKLTEEEMEEAKHKIGYIDKTLMETTPERYGSRRDAIIDNIDSFVERSQETRESEVDTEKEEETPVFTIANTVRRSVCANFLSSAIFDGRVMMKKYLQQTESDLSCYGVNAVLSIPILVDDTQEKLVSQISECTSFLRIQAVLKNALVSKTSSSVSKTLASRIDAIFTKEINSILNNRLSLDTKIDSFVSDAADLINYLKDNLGQVFADAYLSCQEDFVNTYLNQLLVDQVLHESMSNNLRLDIDQDIPNSKYVIGDKLPVTFITQLYQMTYLQVQAADLSISQFGTVGTEVLLSTNPELYKLAKEMFDEEDNSFIPVAHRLLITADNVVYEFHKGLINKDFITISRFH